MVGWLYTIQVHVGLLSFYTAVLEIPIWNVFIVTKKLNKEFVSNLDPRVRVPDQLSGTCLFGLDSILLLDVGLTENKGFKYIVEAMF